MNGDPKIIAWLGHRAGAERMAEVPYRRFQKALELSAEGRKFAEAYGDSTVRAFVGFVDIADYTLRTIGRSGEEIAAYLGPFVTGVGKCITQNRGLIDKTIGDELMFVLPDPYEDGGPRADSSMSLILLGLLEAQAELGVDYPLRLGLACGHVFVQRLDVGDYAEWSVFGEAVHLAKRLQEWDRLGKPNPVVGAFGVLDREADAFPHFEENVPILTAGAWLSPEFHVVSDLKGVSPARCALLRPNANV